MKQIAEAYIGSTVISDTVITVPAYFNNMQRQTTMDAGEIAGINVLRIISEPAAAAIAYGLNNICSSTGIAKERNVLIFDLEGGEFKRKHKNDVSGNPKALRRLRIACEKTKRMLSSSGQTRIEINSLFQGIYFSETVTRPKFEELKSDLFIRSINPDEAVAFGAAVEAAILTGRGQQQGSTPKAGGSYAVISRCRIRRRSHEGCDSKESPIPVRAKTWMTTISDYETSLLIKVFKGERAKTSDNNLLGEFVLNGIQLAPLGVPKIKIRFELDACGVLKVSANDVVTRAGKRISVTSGRLPRVEIERMIEEANRFKAQDEMHRKKYEAWLALEKYVCELRENIASFTQKRKAEIKIKATLLWLQVNSYELAEVSEYEEKMKELLALF
ncbi:OLC1v1038950C1 [Oldenlandia corymbosa var. corymbosa]|uniref:OLC1v1038950C1 n=1 Tax=Oldenlandia corymbosa var. corymbosa TaxID=529605 RepID=A0AAV1D2J0_OLDCO|nr:OLC1v1038950C1 [Oldenlandia corymbosa var. corymbosa]